MAYPCLCSPLYVNPPAPCPSGNCLFVPGMTINPSTSVLPCGVAGVVDVGAESDLTNALGTPVWSVVAYDTTAFTSVSISSAGVLSFTSTADAVPGVFYDFVIRVVDPGSLLSIYAVIKVPIKDACFGVNCATGETCNPCTGACLPDVPNAEAYL